MGQRRTTLDKRQSRATKTRERNSLKKNQERIRRDEQLLALIKTSQFPYAPGVMSWLSVKLGKKASRITADDVQKLLT